MQRETSSVYGKVNFLTLCAFFCFKSSMNFGLLCDLRDTNSYSTMYHLARTFSQQARAEGIAVISRRWPL